MPTHFHFIKQDSSRAFTLIELLIVVAIIAILAAIAVPNFLEAQVRSKVSRVKADMRSLSTAIESYAVDYNRYPIDSEEGFLGITPALWTSNRGPDGPINMWNQLTTPVAYITTRLQDPFIPEGSSSVTDQDNSYNSYHFTRVGFWKDRSASGFWANAYGYKYIMRSMGPARVMPRAANGTIIVPLGILSGMVNYSGSGSTNPSHGVAMTLAGSTTGSLTVSKSTFHELANGIGSILGADSDLNVRYCLFTGWGESALDGGVSDLTNDYNVFANESVTNALVNGSLGTNSETLEAAGYNALYASTDQQDAQFLWLTATVNGGAIANPAVNIGPLGHAGSKPLAGGDGGPLAPTGADYWQLYR